MRHILYLTILVIASLLASSCKSDKKEATALEVDFTYSPTSSSPNEIAFIANIEGNYDVIRWDFGDGQNASGITSATHLYSKAGAYKVVVSAWKGLQEFKCEKTVLIEKNIIDFDFSFTADSSSPNIINFSATVNGTYEKVAWDFGDNETAGNVLTSSTTYLKSGSYNVTLSVWALGLQFKIVKIITIANDYIAFTATPTSSNEYKYKLAAIINGPYSSVKWNFRNKEINNVTDTIAYFPFKGSYQVLLTVTNGNKTFTVQKDITISTSDPNYVNNLSLVWADEFESSTLNTSNWVVETGVHVNNELQTYTSSGNYSISNGILTLICKKENDNGSYGSYTSARLKTQGKQSFKYGRVEARLRLPKGLGTWPAFWMLGDNIGTGVSWPACGEIDIMEYVGADPLWVQGSLHAQDFFGGNSKSGRFQLSTSNDEEEWHVYGMIWQSDKISFYVDDYTKPFYTYNAPATKTANSWPYDNNFFILLNLAFGGDWGGYKGIDKTLDNMQYDIDWVRYYNEK